MQITRLSEITIDKIKNRGLKKVLPELYKLEKIIENNGSHNNQPVFEHIISVLTALDELLPGVNQRIKNYLAEKIDAYSRKQLLFLATILHDIGKGETMKRDGNTVSFPSHEAIGSEKLEIILPRLDLSEKERKIVMKTIKNHGFFHNLLDQRANLDLNQKISEFREMNRDIFYEVVLLTKADLLGGHLMKNKPEEFNFRMDFLIKIT